MFLINAFLISYFIDTGCPEQCASATDCKSGKGKIAGGKVTSNYQRLCKHYCSSNGYCGTVDKTTNCTGCKKIGKTSISS